MLNKPRVIFICLLIITGLVCIVSCDKAKKHRVLTFFFDGVPPLWDPNAIQDPNSKALPVTAGRRRAAAGSDHGWTKEDCSICHGEKADYSSSSKLASQVPGLCYQCHEDESMSQRYMHGPVAKGDCLFCHDPHRSGHQYLLNYSAPELCLRCHNREALEAIDHLVEPIYSKCLECHAGHSSPGRFLLRSNQQDQPVEVMEPNSVVPAGIQ